MEDQSDTDESGTETIQEDSIVDSANKAAILLKKENDRFEQLLQRQEQLQAKQILGGRTDASDGPTKQKEETPEEYVQRLERGEL